MESFVKNNITSVQGNIQQQSRVVINNVLSFLKELKEDPVKLKELNFDKPRELTAMICGISLRTVDRIKKESASDEITSPREQVCQPRPVTGLDDFDKSVIKQIVFSFYAKREFPTAKKILTAAMERIDGFKCSVSSMRTILHDLGYRFKIVPDGRKQLMERRDIVSARLQFLRKLDDLKKSGDTRPRIYIDETWVNQNHSRKRVWVDENNEGGLKKPIGKGSRLIVCHAGCEKYGFMPGAKWVFRAVKSKNEDYHTEMDAEGFTDWFTRLLQSLEEPSILIMDNASYHSKQINRVPTTRSTKAEIQEWLRQHNIPFSESAFKDELLLKIQANRGEKTYHLDQLANEYGHEVIRLPPYHCQYNPIELIWAQVKGEVAEKNKTFKIADVEKLTNEAIENVTVGNWQKCVRHAETLQEQDLKKSFLCERLIINVNDSDTDDDDDD